MLERAGIGFDALGLKERRSSSPRSAKSALRGDPGRGWGMVGAAERGLTATPKSSSALPRLRNSCQCESEVRIKRPTRPDEGRAGHPATGWTAPG